MCYACVCGRKLAEHPRKTEIRQRLGTIRERRKALIADLGTPGAGARLQELRELTTETDDLREELGRLARDT